MTEQPHWTPTDELVLQRIYEFVTERVAAEPDEERRLLLQEYLDDGDHHIQPSRPGYVLLCVGDLDVGEASILALRRPDDPERN